jgi:hypothetical protein
VRKFLADEEEANAAEEAARQIVASKPRDINSLSGSGAWKDYNDAFEVADVANRLRGGGGVRVDNSGFGTGMSVKQGGATVATSSGFRAPNRSGGSISIYGPQGAGADPMAAVDNERLRAQQIRMNDYRLQEAANNLADDARANLEGGDFDVFSGRYGKRAGAVGDVQRSEFARNKAAEARTYFDTDVAAQRDAETDRQERLLTARYGREADAAAKIEAARIAAAAKEGAARTTAGGAMNREAIRALLKSRELTGLIGGSDDQVTQFEDLMRGMVPGQEAPQGIDTISFNALLASGNSPAGRQQLTAIWDQLSPEQQAQVRTQLGRR